MSTVNVNRVVDASGGVLAPISSVMRNRIINGAMVIDQRNAGASVSVDGAFPYITDRWQTQDFTDGVFSAQQVIDAPAGFVNSLKITVTTADASLATNQIARVQQPIEGYNISDFGWGTANAKTVTFSFWVKSSLTGTFGGSFVNSGNTRSYPFTYTVNAANTWEQKSITIAGDTSGTWLTTNGIGVQVIFSLAAGTSFLGTAGAWAGADYRGATGQSNFMGTLSATWQVTGCQLEVGTQATSFEYRQYQQELALCQRYCEVIRPSGATNFAQIGVGQAYATVAAQIAYYYQVAKRSQPTVTYDTASKYALTNSTDGAIACSAISTGRSDVTSLAITATIGTTSLTAGHASRLLDNNTNNPVTIISSEL
jgi:hypothetical protein